jgi:hypothetical protein
MSHATAHIGHSGRRSRSSFRCEGQSLAQALKDRTQQRRISPALHADHRPTWKPDVNRTGHRRLLLCGGPPNFRLSWSSNSDRKQSCRCYRGIYQLTALERPPPLEHLVRVQPVSPCYLRHTRTRLECQFRNPPLLCNRPPSASARSVPAA